MQQPRRLLFSVTLLISLVSLNTLPAAAAARGAGSTVSSGSCSSTATTPFGSCSPPPQQAGPPFPTDNSAKAVGGRQLHELLSSSHPQHAVVVLFHLAGDPPSVAITPVFKCLPAFFPEEVQFVIVAYSELSLMALISQGLHALPVLQVNTNGRRYRYSGKHRLAPMLHFVARALGQEPVVGLDVAQFCSSSSSSMRLPRTPSDPPPGTCRPHSLQALLAARAGSAGGVCDRDSMCSRGWDCVRWDGEVTLEELRAQRPAPLFYISLVFLVLRAAWLGQRWMQRHRQSQRTTGGGGRTGAGAAVAVAAAVAAAAAGPDAG